MLGKCLFVSFCLSVTFWYIGTPYIVRPSEKVVQDLINSNSLSEPISHAGKNTILVENWTKWRLYHQNEQGKEEILFKNSAKYIPLLGKETNMHFEWRSHYNVVVYDNPPEPRRAYVESSWLDKFGIYDHLIVEIIENNRLRIVPKFMFGIDQEILDELYKGPEKMPIIGYFGSSPFVDRVVIMSYLFLVLVIMFIVLARSEDTKTKKKREHED
ncbi:uncharacterized protein [Lepeophtheirus salmonis]|uniref:uncharacterized protein n=1 Tax=Lepeophtheirus salmonis TaxID=72036 RepID=UPI001AE91355|nr:uncharacterized protein LOC121122726 [Lepeophtheirus salmonis]XP_040573690.1 uncharacterized protein LOC121122726 [Lepeophtheirus salmonis]XP_040573692.1 uncharacterized protein LOC121122726 [Lepeophtheirus salmonis]XP_040573693.1 uncharacterized protein LOC121122726 [Lepeophtheirus salmonis]